MRVRRLVLIWLCTLRFRDATLCGVFDLCCDQFFDLLVVFTFEIKVDRVLGDYSLSVFCTLDPAYTFGKEPLTARVELLGFVGLVPISD